MSKYKPHAIFNPYRCKVYPFATDMDLGRGSKTYVWEDELWQPLEKVAPKDCLSFSLSFRPGDKDKDIAEGLMLWCGLMYSIHYPWLTISKTARMVRVWLAKEHNRHYAAKTIYNLLQSRLHFPDAKVGRTLESTAEKITLKLRQFNYLIFLDFSCLPPTVK